MAGGSEVGHSEEWCERFGEASVHILEPEEPDERQAAGAKLRKPCCEKYCSKTSQSTETSKRNFPPTEQTPSENARQCSERFGQIAECLQDPPTGSSRKPSLPGGRRSCGEESRSKTETSPNPSTPQRSPAQTSWTEVAPNLLFWKYLQPYVSGRREIPEKYFSETEQVDQSPTISKPVPVLKKNINITRIVHAVPLHSFMKVPRYTLLGEAPQ